MATAPMKLYTRTRVLLFDTSENTEVESFHIRIDLNNHLFFCLCLSVTSLMRLRKKKHADNERTRSVNGTSMLFFFCSDPTDKL